MGEGVKEAATKTTTAVADAIHHPCTWAGRSRIADAFLLGHYRAVFALPQVIHVVNPSDQLVRRPPGMRLAP